MAPRRPSPGQAGAPAAPPALIALAVVETARRRLLGEWRGLQTGGQRLARTRAPKLIATPRDFRPTDPEIGRALLAGRFRLAGVELDVGPGGDPWNRPSPTRRFAVELHRFAFLPHLAASGVAGAREGLRLLLDWRRAFGRPDAFAWGPEVLERRVFNLACATRRLGGVASEVESAELLGALQQQAHHLLDLGRTPVRAAERAVAATLAAAALGGPAAERLLTDGLKRLTHDLELAVLPDGGHRTRSPQAGLELLFDLLSLDDLLLQRGREAPQALVSTVDRLGALVRFHTFGDGRLASFHGGEAVAAAPALAAMGEEPAEAAPPSHASHSAYHRLCGPTLQVIADAGPPAQGPWSLTACAQPLALEVVAGGDRLFANSGWSPDAAGPQAMRLSAAGNTADVGRGSAGWPLTGFMARALGPRLVYAPQAVEARRAENEDGVWLELVHDGWARSFGLTHTRRLFVAHATDEMRGEDVFTPAPGASGRKAATFTVHFHLFPGVQASVARDGRSVLLRGPSDRGWWFRNDAAQVSLEASVCFLDGQPRRTQQVALGADVPLDGPARVRWKLSPVEPAPRPRSSSQVAATPQRLDGLPAAAPIARPMQAEPTQAEPPQAEPTPPEASA